MAFAFRKDETVRHGVRRLVRKRAERALEWLDTIEEPEAIHGVRKEIKKVRSILRLVRSEIGRSSYEKEIVMLREAASHLARARDAHVRLQAFNRMVEHFCGPSDHTFDTIKAALMENSRAEVKRFLDGGGVKVVRGHFVKLARDCTHYEIQAQGWAAISPGLKRSYSRGRSARETVLVDPSPVNFHDWRRRVKDLWYQARVVSPAWPEHFKEVCDSLKRLSDYLGDDHDLVLLSELIGRSKRMSHEEVDALAEFIDLRHKELRSAALALGARFYVEEPKVFCRRLGGYWDIWTHEPAPGAPDKSKGLPAADSPAKMPSTGVSSKVA